ncbi:MAG: cellulose binding domain-containing protein [Roseburia faecis]
MDSDWGDGFTGRVLITNNTEQTLEDWVLEMDFARQITNIWDGKIKLHEENHYIIQNAGYNSNIMAGQTISFGFNGINGKLKLRTLKCAYAP